MENAASEKYLLFSTDNRLYAIPLRDVKEILRMVRFHPVSELPPFVAGVINLRGYMLPVIDFKQRARLGQTQPSIKTRIIVVRLSDYLLGLMVDRTHEVIEISSAQISGQIQTEVVLDKRYIQGMTTYNKQWVTLVDLHRLLTDQEYQWLSEQTHESAATQN